MSDRRFRLARWRGLGRLGRYVLHLGDDRGQAAVGDPFLVEADLRLGKAAADGASRHAALPFPVGTVTLGWVGLAAAAGLAAGHVSWRKQWPSEGAATTYYSGMNG